MSEVITPRFSCPACARVNVWKQSIAGKRAKCACGQIVTVPSFAPSAVAVAPPAVKISRPKGPTQTPAAPVMAAATSESPVGGAMSRSVMAGIPYRKGLQPEPVAAASKVPSELRDVVLPIVLILAGLYVAGTDALQTSGPGATLAGIIGPLILNIAIGLSLAVAAVLGGSMMAGIAFHGPMWQNILKLCAVALLPLPIGSMAGRAVGGLNGDIVSSLVSIGCYFALFWAVFKMAWSDRAVCVLLIWIIRSGVAYLMFKIMGESRGSSI